jgi:hypothetical protein
MSEGAGRNPGRAGGGLAVLRNRRLVVAHGPAGTRELRDRGAGRRRPGTGRGPHPQHVAVDRPLLSPQPGSPVPRHAISSSRRCHDGGHPWGGDRKPGLPCRQGPLRHHPAGRHAGLRRGQRTRPAPVAGRCVRSRRPAAIHRARRGRNPGLDRLRRPHQARRPSTGRNPGGVLGRRLRRRQRWSAGQADGPSRGGDRRIAREAGLGHGDGGVRRLRLLQEPHLCRGAPPARAGSTSTSNMSAAMFWRPSCR